ncbi:phosphoenolpyruvate--protein phosphotransferase [Haloplasma contractile]|uniref:Phosphoenolpyruvate-protein phosphotransferase n=1 Tax=Haloplasma contractile SSD-17B TaxID=1033810 RepID=U2EFZ6_9MOLU|nr:phosphoenolpyruvate--protein phosphotransferase [Haloplasma contractile]ERJ13843.1 Phosphoenolpyruvate-protein phosphotransferase [Haloplasma contractile SSD-17B]
MIKGITASQGYAIGKVYKLEELKLNVTKETITDVENEEKRLTDAIVACKKELKILREKAANNVGEDHAQIFDAHLLLVNDPDFVTQVIDIIKKDNVCVEYAVKQTREHFVAIFEAMDNEYMKERASDIKDVTNRILAKLLKINVHDPSSITSEVIIVSDDLTPSETSQLNKELVKGFITNVGGRTSHSAIMARSLEIPAIVGTKSITSHVKHGDFVIINAIDGFVIVNPNENEIMDYKNKIKEYEHQKQEWAQLKDTTTKTRDNVHVELAANIGTPNDLKGVLENGAEGIGLYRTEFLYMDRTELPTEEQQYDAYKKVLASMGNKPVVVRTLDIGGDKELPYLDFPKEMNPFLGYRAIRLCLKEKSIFETQLRALLRASTEGNLKIMFPMIATIDEFIEARDYLLSVKDKLFEEGYAVSEDIEIGMMVEIPSAALLADKFADVVDFFSIGTNDLIQYTFAADRMNEHVSYLYQPYNPSLLRLIDMVIQAAHAKGKWVGMCGEMAGDEIAVPILLGLGLDEFSMSSTSILPTRALLSKLSKEEMKQLGSEALKCRSANEVEQLVKATVKFK